MPANEQIEEEFFAQLAGHEVIVHLMAAVPGRSAVRGVLREWSAHALTVEAEGTLRLIYCHAVALIEPQDAKPARFD